MSNQDNKNKAQKRRRLQAMQRSYIFLNEWRKNDVWVGNVVHYHKPFSDKDHSLIISRANAVLKNKTLYAFDIETGKKIATANDILSLGGALSTKGLEITSVDSHYNCPFKPNQWFDSYFIGNTERLESSGWNSELMGKIVLVKYEEKVVPYLVGYGHEQSFEVLNGNKTTFYLTDLTNGVIEDCNREARRCFDCLNEIAREQQKRDPLTTKYPFVLGILESN